MMLLFQVKALIKEDLINTEHFLHVCIFLPLFHSVKKHQENSVILLLELLLVSIDTFGSHARSKPQIKRLDFLCFQVVQSEVPNWEEKVSLPALLVFLGKLIEYFTRRALFEESQGSLVRERLLRNIDKILAIPNCLRSFQGKLKFSNGFSDFCVHTLVSSCFLVGMYMMITR